MRTYHLFFAIMTASMILCPLAANAGDDKSAPVKVTTVAGITEYRLDNGLRVLLFPDESKATVYVNITYLVGSRHEGYGESGMAHLLEHMVFKGTPDHPQIWKALQDHGANFNGSTSYDRTNYFETMPATEENLEFGLSLEADRMVNCAIAQKDLDSEFSVVRNEFEMGENSPMNVLSERMMSTAYLWHNYGKSTIGSREDIERVPVDRLRAFYQKYYQPDNAYLIVSGKFDEAKTLAKINEIYGKIPRPQRKLEPTYTVEPTQDGEREVVLRRVGDTQAIGCLYHVCAASHEDMAPLQVLADTLSADQTGRLYKALIEKKLATSLNVDAMGLCEPGVMEIMAEARLDQPLEPIRARMFEVLDSLGQQTFTDEDVNRAKSNFARNFDLMLADSARLGGRLSGSCAQGDWRLMFLQRDRMAKVTPKDVQRVAAHYLIPSNRTVGMFVPTKEPVRASVPPTPDVVALLKDYKDTQEVTKGEAFEATYANVEARTQRSKLPGGMKLALLPKQNRGNRVNGILTFHYGSEESLTGKQAAASLMSPMMMRGTKQHTARQIDDRLAELKARVGMGEGRGMRSRYVRVAQGPGMLTISMESARENLPAVLDLVAEILRQPAFPPDEFEKLQREAIANQEEEMSDPQPLASNALQRRLNQYPPTDIRYVPTPQEQIERLKAVKVDDVQKLYGGLVGASFAEAAFVGDFDPAEETRQLEKLFNDWASPKPFQRIENKFKATEPDTIVVSTPDKTNSMITLGEKIELRDDDPDYPALLMANTILGGQSDSRLFNRIRQTEGLAYGCGSMANVSEQDRVGTFLAFSICAPQNAERAVTCAVEEIKRLIAEGVPQKELDDARKAYRQRIVETLSNDGAVAGMLTRDLYLDRTFKFLEDRLAKVEALTAKDVQAAMAKYVQPGKLVIVRAGDFSKAAPPATTQKSGE
ncbi:MAG TPA: pitrilysin family protein [Phycisphaerae bacterium]|nr:pitrilysin family protein [Phycisphaerae bacterium]